jgi:hypothetical protein
MKYIIIAGAVLVITAFVLKKRTNNSLDSGINESWGVYPRDGVDLSKLISFNESYFDYCQDDNRPFVAFVSFQIKNPQENGMPQSSELKEFSKIESELDTAITKESGVFVGTITGDGERVFIYYLRNKSMVLKDSVEKIAKTFQYTVSFKIEDDIQKNTYLKELYPSKDELRVMNDMKVLSSLESTPDIREKLRRVDHWIYFKSKETADSFAKWATEQKYSIELNQPTEEHIFLVQVYHSSTSLFEDITSHTKTLNRKALELNAEYDGWETSIVSEKKSN